VNREQQLEWEARWGRPAAAAAVGAAILLAGSFALDTSLRGTGVSDARDALQEIGGDITSRIIIVLANVVAVLAMAGALTYLYRATRPRRPETPPAAGVLAIAGPVLYAAAFVALSLTQIKIGREFVALPAGFRTVDIAESVIADSALRTVQLVVLGGSLALGFAYVLISLGAMRAGLLSRFMGILGIISGVLFVIPVLGSGPPVVAIFWLGAMAVLFLDRWPNGRGPAWASGQPEPWPSQMEMARAREAQVQRAQAEPQEPAAAKPRRKKRR